MKYLKRFEAIISDDLEDIKNMFQHIADKYFLHLIPTGKNGEREDFSDDPIYDIDSPGYISLWYTIFIDRTQHYMDSEVLRSGGKVVGNRRFGPTAIRTKKPRVTIEIKFDSDNKKEFRKDLRQFINKLKSQGYIVEMQYDKSDYCLLIYS